MLKHIRNDSDKIVEIGGQTLFPDDVVVVDVAKVKEQLTKLIGAGILSYSMYPKNKKPLNSTQAYGKVINYAVKKYTPVEKPKFVKVEKRAENNKEEKVEGKDKKSTDKENKKTGKQTKSKTG